MRLAFFPLLVLTLLLTGCSSGPRKTADQQFFEYAQANLERMEYDNALKNIDQMIDAAGQGPRAGQGLLTKALLLAALADGAKRMAEAYQKGSREPTAEARQAQFVKMKNDYYGIARVRFLNAMETVMSQRGKLGDQAMTLPLGFPGFSGTDAPAVKAAAGGNWVADAERYRAELETTRNALARILTAVTGAGDDLHKGQAAFQAGTVELDSRVYLVEMNDAFLRLKEIFERRALDDSRYRRICFEVIRDNMDLALQLLEKRPDEALEKKARGIKKQCEDGLKKMDAAF